MSVESNLAGIEIYYSTHVGFIIETVISTMLFWGYETTFMEDGSIRAIRSITRPFMFQSQEFKNEALPKDKLNRINYQINQKPETVRDNILKMGLIYLFSLYEGFNKDYFEELFTFKPELMKSKRKVEIENLLHYSNIQELYISLARKEVERFGYLDIDGVANMIRKKFKIDIENELDCWRNLREAYYRRNLIVHNDGRISERYCIKLSLGEERVNEELPCTIEYLWNCHKHIQFYMDFIDERIRKKFKLKSLVNSL